LWTRWPNFGEAARWPDGLLVVLTAATTVTSLSRRLPAQNVILASAIIVFIAGAVQTLGAVSGIPFGPYYYTKRIGQVLFEPLPWGVPLVWLVVILNARGTGRLILRPWRKTRNYGFWLMGLTVLLAVLFDLGLEPFATEVKKFWKWSPSHAGLYWYSTPWVNFIGWAATVVMILAFATPSLINKKPEKKPVKHPPDYHPLVIWALLNLMFLTGTVSHQLWLAAGVVLAGMSVVTIFAIKGATW
jgi:putative membrane protein